MNQAPGKITKGASSHTFSSSPGLLTLVILTGVLGAAMIFSAGLGFIEISPGEILQIITAALGGHLPDTIDASYPFVIMEVRLPRIITAVLVGGGLAVAGCIFQSLLQNPLADPYTLGISSGAAFGASIAILLLIVGSALPSSLIIPLFAFGGALLTLVAVFSLAAPSTRLSSNSLILAGIIISAILSAGISLIKFLADEQVNAIIFWLMGSFIGKDWADVLLLSILVLPSTLILMLFSREMDIMTFGDRTSEALGIDTTRIRRFVLIVASLSTSGCVAVSGIIGFVGLIVPHFVRMILGPSNTMLIPVSFLCGCILLLGADTVTRVLLPTEIPIGVLTALIGGPLFCYIFRKTQLQRWR
jgi:iron complex transport system permease protein